MNSKLSVGRCAVAVLMLVLALPCMAAAPRVLNDDVHFAEGPVWHDGQLYYVEYDRNTVDAWDGHSNRIVATLPGCGPSAVIVRPSGEFYVTCYDSNSIGRLSATGVALPALDHDRDGHKFSGPNDFAADAAGGLYFTGSGHPGTAIDGQLFYLAADGTITQVASALNAANGVALSRDGKTLYLIETEAHHLLRYQVGAPGHISGRSVFLDLDQLMHRIGHFWPDGVKIDSRGQIYIGQNPRDPGAPLAGMIFVVNESGRLLRTLSLPSPGVPNLAFSPDERTVYVTALDQLDKSPYRGKLYAIDNP
jgi:sugar lactone lactonase YvrE